MKQNNQKQSFHYGYFRNLWKQNHSAYYQYRFNRSFVNAFDHRNAYMKRLIHAKGLFKIQQPFHCIYGDHITVGRDFTCGHNAYFEDDAEIIIKNHVQIGNNVKLLTVKFKHVSDNPTESEAIMIEDYVMIGNDVTIMPGVTIREGAIINDGCIINHDVEANQTVFVKQTLDYQIHESQTMNREAASKWEQILDHVDLDKADALIRGMIAAGNVFCAYKAIKLFMKKKAAYEAKKAMAEKYIPLMAKYEKGAEKLKKYQRK